VVPFPALLGRARSDFLRDADPVVWAISGDEVDEPLVFVLRPGTAAMSDHGGSSRQVW
jgi:hypothetical protein